MNITIPTWLRKYHSELYHYGVKGMRWGVRRTPEELGHYSKKGVPISRKSSIIKSKGIPIHRSLGAKAKNYEILDPLSGERFHFSEGTRIKNPKVFAGKGGVKKLRPETVEGLVKQIGGKPSEWQHCKGIGTIDFYGEDRQAEVHWFQESSVGKHRFKIKTWLE